MYVKHFILVLVVFRLVEIKSECNNYFKCLSAFLKYFIDDNQKYDITININNQNKTLQITLKNLDKFIKHVIDLLNVNIEDHEETLNNSETIEHIDKKTTTYVKSISKDKTNKISNIESSNLIGTYISNKNTMNMTAKIKNITKHEINIFHSKSEDLEEFVEYYDFTDDNTTDYPIIDYIDLYKDTTNELVQVFKANYSNIENRSDSINYVTEISLSDMQEEEKHVHENSTSNVTTSVSPWIAAIFLKNGTSDQFEYYCDGVLLSDRYILTAARCVIRNDATVDAENVIVLLGKKSLLSLGENERAVKISKIILHENYTNKNDKVENDLAILEIEEPISFNDAAQSACVLVDETSDDFIENNLEIATTGWAITGELTFIPFDKEKSKKFNNGSRVDNVFCANYNNDVTVCPSFGGVFVSRAVDNIWYLRGLRTGDPTQKSFCINTGVLFTNLLQYLEWIQIYM
ncbi:unnamed protein product [Parnassius mnemosyne]|uniref:Peptidase S1 domain-containing protein n=1 Tax=Parnassius mnemosyne TaxID=213953 RepID=A0AAV1L511_9NEOP